MKDFDKIFELTLKDVPHMYNWKNKPFRVGDIFGSHRCNDWKKDVECIKIEDDTATFKWLSQKGPNFTKTQEIMYLNTYWEIYYEI